MRPFTLDRLEDLYRHRGMYHGEDLTPLPTFWRHDVDVSLSAALHMARFERDVGARSTYYLMTDSPFYLPEEAFSVSLRIAALGHRVGLHIDPRRATAGMLEAAVPGARVSWHCPRPKELWKQYNGFDCAYDEAWEGSYYSDSRGEFAYGDPEDDGRTTKLQINLHPEWWFDPAVHDGIPDDVYEGFFHEPKSRLAARP